MALLVITRESSSQIGYLRIFCSTWHRNIHQVRVYFKDRKKRKLPEFSGATCFCLHSEDPAQVVVPWRYIIYYNIITTFRKYRWVYDGNNSASKLTITHSVTSSFFYPLLFAIAPSVLDTCLVIVIHISHIIYHRIYHRIYNRIYH